jgi:hypothetical protein
MLRALDLHARGLVDDRGNERDPTTLVNAPNIDGAAGDAYGVGDAGEAFDTGDQAVSDIEEEHEW